MVTNSALAAVCVEMGLYKHVIYESPQLGDEIDEYARQVKRARDLEYKVADNEGRPPGQYWVDIEPPKVNRCSPSTTRLDPDIVSCTSHCRTSSSPLSALFLYWTTSRRAAHSGRTTKSSSRSSRNTSRFRRLHTIRPRYSSRCSRAAGANTLRLRKAGPPGKILTVIL